MLSYVSFIRRFHRKFPISNIILSIIDTCSDVLLCKPWALHPLGDCNGLLGSVHVLRLEHLGRFRSGTEFPPSFLLVVVSFVGNWHIL